MPSAETKQIEKSLKDLKSKKTTLLKFLTGLPDETHPEFELSLNRLIETQPKTIKQLETIIDKSTTNDDSTVYPAFYATCIYYRRMKEISKLETILKQFSTRFGKRPMFNHLYAAFLQERGKPEDIEEAIFKAKSAVAKIKDNPGVHQNFAEIIATAFEEKITNDSSLLNKAEESITTAIELSPNYAKYYCTYGRINSIKGEHAKATSLIRRAIDIENPNRSDYAIRIGDFQYHLSKITAKIQAKTLSNKIQKYVKTIETQQSEITHSMNEMRRQNLEFLGFFAALISLTIGSIQILNNQPFEQASQLILILFGALLCAFGGFGIMLHGKHHFFRSLGVFLFGLIIIAAPRILAQI